MKTYQDVDQALEAVNTLTNELATVVAGAVSHDQAQVTEIAALKEQIADGTAVTPEQLDALAAKSEARVAALTVVVDTLKAAGIDGSIPEVPDVPPLEEPPVDPNADGNDGTPIGQPIDPNARGRSGSGAGRSGR